MTGGDVLMDGQSLFEMEDPDERARAGLFLAFQYPMEIPDVTIANFIRAAVQAACPRARSSRRPTITPISTKR